MGFAPDRISSTDVSTLRQVKEKREQRALAEWQAREAERGRAAEAETMAQRALDTARDERALRDRLYGEMLGDATSVAALERHRLHLEKLSEEIARQETVVASLRRAREQAEARAAEGRARWARASAVTRKWGLIETDVSQAHALRDDLAGEIETEDDLASRAASPGSAAGPTL